MLIAKLSKHEASSIIKKKKNMTIPVLLVWNIQQRWKMTDLYYNIWSISNLTSNILNKFEKFRIRNRNSNTFFFSFIDLLISPFSRAVSWPKVGTLKPASVTLINGRRANTVQFSKRFSSALTPLKTITGWE